MSDLVLPGLLGRFPTFPATTSKLRPLADGFGLIPVLDKETPSQKDQLKDRNAIGPAPKSETELKHLEKEPTADTIQDNKVATAPKPTPKPRRPQKKKVALQKKEMAALQKKDMESMRASRRFAKKLVISPAIKKVLAHQNEKKVKKTRIKWV